MSAEEWPSNTPTETAAWATILVVDDERNIRLTVSDALTALEARVITAVNGEDALQRIAEERVDLVLLDLALPGKGGLQVLRELASSRPAVPVVIISAHGTVGTAVEAMKLGAVEFIEKPFSPADVRHAVVRALRAGGG